MLFYALQQTLFPHLNLLLLNNLLLLFFHLLSGLFFMDNFLPMPLRYPLELMLSNV